MDGKTPGHEKLSGPEKQNRVTLLQFISARIGRL